MTELIAQTAARWGAAGIGVLVFLENIFPPIPSEVLLPFAGFLTTYTPLPLGAVIGAATAGSLLGAGVLYFAGSLADEERLCAFCRGKGRALGLSEEQVRRAVARYAAGAEKTVFFCRMVPILRSLISIPAGMAGMPLVRFLPLTAAGSFLWNLLLCGLGAALGDGWMLLSDWAGFYGALVRLCAAGCAVWLLARRFLIKRR